MALKLKPIIAEKAKERMLSGVKNPTQKSAEGETRQKLAKVAGVSHDTIAKKAEDKDEFRLNFGTQGSLTEIAMQEEIEDLVKGLNAFEPDTEDREAHIIGVDPQDPINRMAEEAQRELQRQADEAQEMIEGAGICNPE